MPNFSSAENYHKWLAYGHANKLFENTPGNQPVSIKGKSHDVKHADGGNMDFLTHFNTGGSHEENPLGGIPQGMTPGGGQNLVEEGETKLKSEDYVFSDNLKIDEDTATKFKLPNAYIGKTFADLSKKFDKSGNRRENDSIEKADTKRNLDNLMEAQEDFKAKELQKDIQMMQEKHPDFMNMMQNQQPNIEPTGEPGEPQINNNGGYMYPNGGFLQDAGKFLQTASPYLGQAANMIIPGSGIIVSGAAGGLGAGLQNVNTGADTKEVVKDVLFGAGKSSLDSVMPGAGNVLGMAEGTLNNNTLDASEIKKMQMEKAALQDPNVATSGMMFDEGGPLFPSVGEPFTASFPSPYIGEEPLIPTINDSAVPKDNVSLITNPELKSVEGLNPVDQVTWNPDTGDFSGTPYYGESADDFYYGEGRVHTNPTEQDPYNIDLSFKQTIPQGIAQALPAAYNIGMGLFGKPLTLNYKDYTQAADIAPWEFNINPQLQETHQSFAQGQNALRNAANSPGAYLSNMQQLNNARNRATAELYTQKENIDAQNDMQAQLANKNIEAQNKQMRFTIEDYNQKAKAAKQGMLATGLEQVAQAGQAGQLNDLQLKYLQTVAPDFASNASYKSMWDQLSDAAKKQIKKANKTK